MKKIFILIIFLLSVSLVIAGRPNFVPAEVSPSNGHASVIIPSHAIEKAPGIFSLGTGIDVDGRKVEGFAIVKRKDNFAKPGTECGNGICEPGENANKCAADCSGGNGEPESTCFAYIGKNAKWKSVEPYVINPANVNGLDTTTIVNNIADSIVKWEDAATVEIMGSGSETSDVLVADMINPDGVNEVYFGDIDDPGTVGVTIVWGIFRGPPSGRELVEWDQVYDEVDYNWSLTGEALKMDFENVASHELGHSVGMGHPSDDCTEETMYRFVAFGETIRRTLEAGDKAGVLALYA